MSDHRWVLRRAATLGIVFGTLAAAPAAAATLEARPGGLAAKLNQARPGDTVLLRGGTYSDVATVPAYQGPVTLTAYPGERPVLRNVKLNGGANLTVTGLFSQRLTVTGHRDLVVDGNEFTMGGVWLHRVPGLRFTRNLIRDSNDGLSVDDSTDFVIADNECTRVPLPQRPESGDCIQMARTARWAITRNWIHDQPLKPHVDAIEVTDTNSDGVISHNRIVNQRGIVFTPGDNTPGRSQYRMTIANNLIVARSFALSLVRMNDSRVLYNTIPGTAGIVTWGGLAAGNAMVGNILHSVRFSDVRRARTMVPVEDFNLIATATSGYTPGANDLAGLPTFVDAAGGDHHLMPSSKGYRYGETTHLPVDDLTGMLRGGPDLGALASW